MNRALDLDMYLGPYGIRIHRIMDNIAELGG